MSDSGVRTTRRLTVFAAAVVAAGSVFVAPHALSAAEAAATKKTFRVAYLNINRNLSAAQFRHDFRMVTTRASIVGLGEVAKRRTWLRNWAKKHGWYLTAPAKSFGKDNAVLAKKSMFVKKRGKAKFICDSDGRKKPPPRYITWARYTHKASKRTLFHLNTHLNPRIEKNGRPAAHENVACAKKHVEAIRKLARKKQRKGEVVVTGDLNVDFVADKRHHDTVFPYAVLDEYGRDSELAGLRSCYTIHGVKRRGTHRDRHIDYIYLFKRHKPKRKMWLASYDIFGGTRSDHNGIVATFRISVKR